MAITRRQFVTRLGTLAAAMGLSQMDLAKVTEAFGHDSDIGGPAWTAKPKVLWVHGAECTGCSTSLLSFFEDVTGEAVPGSGISTAMALAIVGGAPGVDTTAAIANLSATSASHPFGHRTLQAAGLNVDGNAAAANIADVLIDFIDLQYHETVMAMGGDLAYTSLKAEMDNVATGNFVLVVEGSVQPKEKNGYWNASDGTAHDGAPWCSIAADGAADTGTEVAFDDVVLALATSPRNLATIAIGQCATFGGYPACQGPGLAPSATGKNMTGAMGVKDFLTYKTQPTAAGKVYNVPGCPTNPWWFVLTTVLLLVKLAGGTDLTERDTNARMKNVYGNLLHSKYCPRYAKYAKRIYASYPGDPNGGCLKNIGCKGISTRSLCGIHGWNAQQPQNALGATAEDVLYTLADGSTAKMGGNCLNAGHPCMGCTEKGYPDSFVPYVIR